MDVVESDQRVAHCCDRVADARAVAGKWSDVEGDTQTVHEQAEATS